jgi:hypothetical protein
MALIFRRLSFVSSSAHRMSTPESAGRDLEALPGETKLDAAWPQLGYQDGSDHVRGLAG